MDLYRERIIELYKNPLNKGKIADPDLRSHAEVVSCGDKIYLYVKLKDNRISEIKFESHSCAISTASACLVTDYLKGKDAEETKKITKEKVLELLGLDLSKNPTRLKCALLILDALKLLKK